MELHRRGWNAVDSTNLDEGRNCGQVLEHSNKLMVCLNVRIAFSLPADSYAVHNILRLYPGPNCMLHNPYEEQSSGWSRKSTPPPLILQKQKVRYLVHNSPPAVLTLI